MAEKRPALGRGLSALIPEAAAPAAGRDKPFELDLDRLVPNPQQPRSVFDEAKLDELAQSIRASGMIQPIIARRARTLPGADGHDRFEIVAGERRWRAAQRAGLLKVPVVVRDVPDERLLEVALIENLQRDDLNPIEEASAYRRLIDELKLTQDEVATAVGKDRSSITNTLRLLRLPDEVRNLVSDGSLSMGHARALLGLDSSAAQRQLAREVVAKGLSVRETEAMVKRQGASAETATPAGKNGKKKDPNTRAAEEKLRFALGTDVEIVRRGKGGRIEIAFGSEEELNRIFEKLTE
ncbi:MAG: ParB/RepB/Spo0J family partition protein [Acidobacteria bacterium]|nr:ParB/RepB/Spo0J family partition protein [Acidobacteriota bacterium]